MYGYHRGALLSKYHVVKATDVQDSQITDVFSSAVFEIEHATDLSQKRTIDHCRPKCTVLNDPTY